MGLFNKKSEEQKRAENRIDELCGGFLGNDAFTIKLQENNLDKSTSNTYYKKILKSEIENRTLNYEDIGGRLDELMKMDVETLENKIHNRQKLDTSLFKTQQDIIDVMGDRYAEEYYKSALKAEAKYLEKEREKEDKIKKIEDKFNIDLNGKRWFECTIEEIKYSTFNNEPRRNVDTAYVVVNNDNVEIFKESIFIKSNMGSRKLFYDNITSIDFDARGKLHASSSLFINTKSAEHIQLKHVHENDYNLLINAFENHIKKPRETAIISKSSKADDLVKYAELYEKGLISEEEFDKLKNEIIHGELNPDFNEAMETRDKEENNRFCTNCGSEVDSDAKFCPDCGNKLD